MDGLYSLLIAAVVMFGVFLLIRQVNLWYFKINEHIALQREIRDYLRQLVSLSGGAAIPMPNMDNWSEKDKIAFKNSSSYTQYVIPPGPQNPNAH